MARAYGHHPGSHSTIDRAAGHANEFAGSKMNPNQNKRIDHVEWARRVNGRWIVHHGLNHSLSAYLDHLAKIDPERMARSCRLAHRLVHSIGPTEDPKPWFYGGMFSLATEAEARKYLAGHPLIASAVPCLRKDENLPAALKSAGQETLEKIRRLRETLDRMAKSS